MINSHLAKMQYKKSSQVSLTDKQVEVRILQNLVSDLKLHSRIDGIISPQFAEALHQNSTFWKILLLDILKPENPLDLNLKQQLTELAEFTFFHTQKVLGGEASVDVLIDINIAILDGLKTSLRQKPVKAALEAV